MFFEGHFYKGFRRLFSLEEIAIKAAFHHGKIHFCHGELQLKLINSSPLCEKKAWQVPFFGFECSRAVQVLHALASSGCCQVEFFFQARFQRTKQLLSNSGSEYWKVQDQRVLHPLIFLSAPRYHFKSNRLWLIAESIQPTQTSIVAGILRISFILNLNFLHVIFCLPNFFALFWFFSKGHKFIFWQTFLFTNTNCWLHGQCCWSCNRSWIESSSIRSGKYHN